MKPNLFSNVVLKSSMKLKSSGTNKLFIPFKIPVKRLSKNFPILSPKSVKNLENVLGNDLIVCQIFLDVLVCSSNLFEQIFSPNGS